MFDLTLNPGDLSWSDIQQVLKHPVRIRLHPQSIPRIRSSAETVDTVLAEDRTVYGINTGFGLLANTRIKPSELESLQRRIVLSHAAGTGEVLPSNTVRLLMVLKINSLARGYSGIRLSVIEALIRLLEHQVYPCIPAKGSVGASGDLAPLAHMSTILLGEGEVDHRGQRRSAEEGLQIAGLEPMVLAPKEGLALLNGTQVSTALAIQGLLGAHNALTAGTVIGALSVEAARGSRTPFDPRIHQARGHQSQIDCSRATRSLLDHSSIEQSHVDCDRVQDPYSLRCQPQVMGACLQQLRDAAAVLLTEANAVSDNPLVFVESGDILSGGNFHAEPVAMAADNIALAIAEIGSLSERRMALLIDSKLSGLPPFLVENGGVNSGFMIAQVTSAALASENKSLAHPASVDSIPTSANQEDHVSMATFAARRLYEMVDNSAGILAVEYLAACQGLDFLSPLTTSDALEAAKAMLRKEVAFYSEDRYFAPDIGKAKDLVLNGALTSVLSSSHPLGLVANQTPTPPTTT